MGNAMHINSLFSEWMELGKGVLGRELATEWRGLRKTAFEKLRPDRRTPPPLPTLPSFRRSTLGSEKGSDLSRNIKPCSRNMKTIIHHANIYSRVTWRSLYTDTSYKWYQSVITVIKSRPSFELRTLTHERDPCFCSFPFSPILPFSISPSSFMFSLSLSLHLPFQWECS